MRSSVVSAPDPWASPPRLGLPSAALGAPRPVRLTPGERTHIGLVYGQSNAGQWGYGAPYVGLPRCEVFNWFDGGVYHAVEPLPGGQTSVVPGAVGGILPRLGDALIRGRACDRFIGVYASVGGTSSADWAPGGSCAGLLPYVIARMQAAGLQPSFIYRHQGEAEPSIGTDRNTYRDRIRAEVALFRAAGWTAPVLVAVTSWWRGVNIPGSPLVEETRAGQILARSDALGIFAGPDTDTLNTDISRGDSAHFNATGNFEHAAMLAPFVVARATPFV